MLKAKTIERTIMKRIVSIVGAAMLSFAAITTQAQNSPSVELVPTNAPPPSPQAFTTSILNYFSSNDPTMQFGKFKLWTEADYQNNVNIASKIALSFDVYTTDPTYTNAITVGVEGGMRNAGIAGTIVDGTAGLQLAYNLNSIRVEGYIDGGYSAMSSQGFAELGIRVDKMLTPNTFAGLSMGFQMPTTPKGGTAFPIIGVIVGAKF